MTTGWKGGHRDSAHDGRRFAAVTAEPGRIRVLADRHPAVDEGRTLFPTTVVDPMDSPRILVGGRNNAKLGAVVQHGPLAGAPIYQVTLEERATCPRSCPVWTGCYGNGMHLARRHDASSPDFLVALWAEVVSTYRAVMNERRRPPGMLVRLHVLGDFPSVQYVRVWADLLEKLPGLHVFGYTARRPDADDDASRATFHAIRELADRDWTRFAIRYSRHAAVPQGAVVVDTPPLDDDVILCPAQMDQTDSCASCGLCFAPAARQKTIAFLRHGPKNPGAAPRPSNAIPAGAPGSDEWWEAQGL